MNGKAQLCVDANGRLTLEEGIAYAKMLREYRLFWYEEIGDPLDFALQATLAEFYPGPSHSTVATVIIAKLEGDLARMRDVPSASSLRTTPKATISAPGRPCARRSRQLAKPQSSRGTDARGAAPSGNAVKKTIAASVRDPQRKDTTIRPRRHVQRSSCPP